MGIAVVVIIATVVSLPIHLLAIRRLGQSRATDVRDFLWKFESLLAIFVSSLIAGFASSYLFFLFLIKTGNGGPLVGIVLISANFYTVPTAFVVGLVAHIKWRKHRIPGTCTQCGYNLTGNVTGICPECGRPASL